MEALRQIVAKFKADLTPLDKGLEKSDRKVSGFESTLKKMGGALAAAFAGGAIVNFTGDLIRSAGELSVLADTMGLTTSELQAWNHAAEQSRVESDELRDAMATLQVEMLDFSKGGAGPAVEALSDLGIEVEDQAGNLRPMSAVLLDIADSASKIENPVEKAGQLSKLFGEDAGKNLVPLLGKSREEIEALRGELESLGFGFDEAFVQKSRKFEMNMGKLQKGFKGLVIQGLGPLLPHLIDLSQSLVEGAKATIPMVKGFVRFIRETKALQAVLAVLSAKGLSVVVQGFLGWVKSMGGLRSILLRVLPLVWKFIAPMLILEDFLVFLAGGESAFGKVLDNVFGKGTAQKVRDLAISVGEFIADFKNSPEKIRAAFRDLAKDLKSRFGSLGEFFGQWGQNLVEVGLFAVSMLTGGWENFFNKLQALGDWALSALDIIWTELKFAGLAAAAGISDAFMGAWNSVIEGAQAALRTIASVLDKIPLMGDKAAKLRAEADKGDNFKGNTDAGAVVSKQWDQARMAIVADIEAATAKAQGKAPPVNNVSNNVQNTNTVNVQVPPGTSESVARNVGAAASRGVSQGGQQNNRATLDALTPAPA